MTGPSLEGPRSGLPEALDGSLAEAVSEFLWSCMADGRMGYANRRFREYVCLTSEELGRRRWQDFVHPGDLASARSSWEEAKRCGERFALEYRPRPDRAPRSRYRRARRGLRQRGRALILLAREFPNSSFTGYDISEEGVARGRAEANDIDNLRFEVKDVSRLDEASRYDLITTFDAVHGQADPAAVLAGVERALRPGGVYLMQDIAGSSHVGGNLDHPLGPALYTISTMHCMTVSLAQNGAGLGAMWGEEKAREMLAEAGFANVEIRRLPHDFQNSYFIAAKT